MPRSHSYRQARYMAACAYGRRRYRGCPPRGVARSFTVADKRSGLLKRAVRAFYRNRENL